MSKEEEFQKELLATFRTEAEEHVSAMSAGLIELEKQPSPERRKEIVEVVFREAHTLKSAARAVNLSSVELVCQAMEGLLATIKRGETVMSAPLFDLLNDATDVLNKVLSVPDTALTPEDRSRVEAIQQELSAAASGNPPTPARGRTEPAPQSEQEPGRRAGTIGRPKTNPLHPLFEKWERGGYDILADQLELSPQPEPRLVTTEKAAAGTETIRIPAARLDALLLKAEELVSAKLAARQHAIMARELKSLLDAWKEQWSKLSSESTGIGRKEFVEINRNFSRKLESQILGLRKATAEDFRSIGGMVDNLLDDLKSVMMFPFSSLLGVFPKLVRDISREQGKEIDFTVQGDDIEIDKRILQEIKDPLIHLARNCIDHGIEARETRIRKNKPEKGSLTIVVSQTDSGKIEISVADDGAGINLEKVKGSALKLGIITEEQAASLGEQDALALIFASGITTSSTITTVSGRGLGMAIVREKAEKLGGTIAIQTAPDKGTTFSIQLPLSLATFRGILLQTGGQVFAVPTMSVESVQRLPWTEVQTVENRETISLSGKAVSLVRLDDILELPHKPSAEDENFISVMVLSCGEKYLAFAYDEMLYEDEILFKSLGKQLSRVRNIAGATVLGSGRVIPILNVPDLIKSALALPAGGVRSAAAEMKKPAARTRSILVVEDSITARTLLVNILESAGYRVTAAVDGVDGFTRLGEGEFDLVVSDILMPRMNGFELTEKIRADKKRGTIPVVIVTGLETPEDRKRGIEVGASAYIVKSSFDQSNLLEVIGRLI